MSSADRDKWDQRYRAGAFAGRPYPSVLLNDWIGKLPRGRALDLACGAGRNALFLARNGFAVTGIDISSEGLNRARAAEHSGLGVDWRQGDLDEELDISGKFQVICLFRYLNRPLIRRLPGLLAPGGVLLLEEHLAVDQRKLDIVIAGPANPAFLVSPNELTALLPSLTVLHWEEGIVTDPDDRHVALARLVGANFDPGCSALRNRPLVQRVANDFKAVPSGSAQAVAIRRGAWDDQAVPKPFPQRKGKT